MAYLKKFSKEMLNVKEFIEPVASKAQISRVREHFFMEGLVIKPDKGETSY